VFELNAGDSFRLGERTVTLVSFEEHWQPDHWVQTNGEGKTLESASVHVDVSGEKATLLLRPYQPPVTVNGLRLYVETTKNWATKCELEQVDGVQRDVRLSSCAEGETWGPPDFVFPLRDYRWRSSTYQNTWSSLVPYNRLYYHRGEDLGAIPDRLEVVAMFDGTVAQSPLPRGDGKSNGLIIRHASGLELRYAHLNTEGIRPGMIEGAAVKAGQPLAKTGMTWNGRRSQTHDPHLHAGFAFEGTRLSTYPFFVEAYFRTYPDDALLPVAGGYYFTVPGRDVKLDGSRSVARPGRKVASHRWTLHDGRTANEALAGVRYDRPGLYSEELTVTLDDGSQDRDFAQVRVYDPDPAKARKIAYGWAYHTPVRGIKPGTEVLFWNRLINTAGPVVLDFGDGSEPQPVRAEATHKYENAGTYTVALSGKGPGDEPVTVRLRVVVEP
jgi:murein DD-endopeptidase MepM/ murein hydrolase activator NlpD